MLRTPSNKESEKLATFLCGNGNLFAVGLACIFIASKYYDVRPICSGILMQTKDKNKRKRLDSLADQLCFTVFGMNISQPSPQTFINLIMGA